MADSHTLVLLDSGLVYAWGDNSRAQLGLGKNIHHAETPTLVTSLLQKRIIAVWFRRCLSTDHYECFTFACFR